MIKNIEAIKGLKRWERVIAVGLQAALQKEIGPDAFVGASPGKSLVQHLTHERIHQRGEIIRLDGRRHSRQSIGQRRLQAGKERVGQDA